MPATGNVLSLTSGRAAAVQNSQFGARWTSGLTWCKTESRVRTHLPPEMVRVRKVFHTWLCCLRWVSAGLSPFLIFIFERQESGELAISDPTGRLVHDCFKGSCSLQTYGQKERQTKATGTVKQGYSQVFHKNTFAAEHGEQLFPFLSHLCLLLTINTRVSSSAFPPPPPPPSSTCLLGRHLSRARTGWCP